MSQPLKLLLPATIFTTHNNLMSCKTRFDLCVVKCASNRVFRVSPEWALLSTHQECLQVYVHPIKEIINLLSSGFIQLLSDFGWYTQSHSQALMNFSLSHHTNLFKATNHFEKPCFWEGEALGYFDVQVDWFLHCHRCPLPDVLFFDQQKWRELTARHLDKNAKHKWQWVTIYQCHVFMWKCKIIGGACVLPRLCKPWGFVINPCLLISPGNTGKWQYILKK